MGTPSGRARTSLSVKTDIPSGHRRSRSAPTGHGRKGLAFAEVTALFARVDSDFSKRKTTGLSTGEGLIHAVRDPAIRPGNVKDPGVTDKRLLVVEQEFARTLKVMNRETNVLSAVIRQAWDTGDLRVLTKVSPDVATGAHISIIGHITKEELLRYMDSTDAANGFGNRFLWVAVMRSKYLPDGGAVPQKEWNRLAQRLADALAFATGVGELRRDPAAKSIWHWIYPALSLGAPGLIGALTGRAEPQVMRLACVYALLDLSTTVTDAHIVAAIAYWKRVRDSVGFIFGDATGDPIADLILRELRQNGPMTQTEISNSQGRHIRAERLAKAMDSLARHGLVQSERVATAGRSSTIWKVRV